MNPRNAAGGLPGGDAAAARRRGRVLVALQFLLIAALAALALRGLGTAGPLRLTLGGLLFGSGLLVMAAALRAQRLDNFRIHPEPRTGGRLVCGGPYHWVRHPMYSAVLLCGAGAAGLAPAAGPGSGLLAVALLLALLGVLRAKAVLEEAWMAAVHPGYPAYAAPRGRFLPRFLPRRLPR